MNNEFQRLLDQHREACYEAARKPGPRQINWLTQVELNMMAFIRKVEEKKCE